MRSLFCILIPVALTAAEVPAPTAQQLKIGSVNVSGSFRTRMESWDWFQGEASNDYTYLGSILRVSLSQSKKAFDWQLELAAPFLLGLPDDAIAAGTQGQLGLGASYFAANSRNSNAGMVFAKQGFLRFKGIAGIDGQSLKIGSIEPPTFSCRTSALPELHRGRSHASDLAVSAVQSLGPQ